MKKIIRSVYNIIPFKKEFYGVLKIFWNPRESIYKHLHFKSPFTVRIDDTKKFKIYNGTIIENEIFWKGLTGKWEKESMKLWLKLCEDSNTIFDIGANNGVYALAAKTVNPLSRVYAFEPHPLFFEMLQNNARLNHFDISCHRKAVSAVDGNVSIEDYSGNSKSIAVESITLDSFIEQNQIGKIDLMKIDVETFEPQVMEGFRKFFSQFKPTLIIEILNEHVAQIIFDVVSPHHYLYFNIDEAGGIRQIEKIERSDYYNYLLCNKETAIKLGLIKNLK